MPEHQIKRSYSDEKHLPLITQTIKVGRWFMKGEDILQPSSTKVFHANVDHSGYQITRQRQPNPCICRSFQFSIQTLSK